MSPRYPDEPPYNPDTHAVMRNYGGRKALVAVFDWAMANLSERRLEASAPLLDRISEEINRLDDEGEQRMAYITIMHELRACDV